MTETSSQSCESYHSDLHVCMTCRNTVNVLILAHSYFSTSEQFVQSQISVWTSMDIWYFVKI